MVQRWDPFRDLLSIQEHMNRLFEGNMVRHQHTAGLTGWHPQSDISETEEAFHLYIEIAGMEQSDIDIRVEGDVLTIRGERQRPHPANATFLQTEILMGPFHRLYKLPSGIIAENIQARYHRGILELILPKQPKPQTKQIDIQVK